MGLRADGFWIRQMGPPARSRTNSGLASLWQLARLVPAGNFRPRRKCSWRTRRNVCRAGGRLEHIAVHECSVYVVLPYRRVRDVLHWLARQPRVEQGESAMKRSEEHTSELQSRGHLV